MKESRIRLNNLMLEKSKIAVEEIRKFLLYKSDFVEHWESSEIEKLGS